MDDAVQHKLAIMLNNLVRVGFVTCNSRNDNNRVCSILKPKKSSPIVFYYDLPSQNDLQTKADNELHDLAKASEALHTADYKQIAKIVLSYLPDIQMLDDVQFKNVLDNLKDVNNKDEKPWLIQFVSAYQPNVEDLELKKLPSILKKGDFLFE